MRAVSPKVFPGSADELRRRLLAQFSEPQPAPPQGSRTPALQTFVDGFMQGSLLTLAVCAPKRRSSLTSSVSSGEERRFRTYIVSLPGKTAAQEPVPQEPDVETVPAAS